jgi:hypothetical protein
MLIGRMVSAKVMDDGWMEDGWEWERELAHMPTCLSCVRAGVRCCGGVLFSCGVRSMR